MYADQFAQSLVAIANDGQKKPKFDALTVASRLRDSISGYETDVETEETEVDGVETDLVADVSLDESDAEDGGASE
jgi:hypothetical protein